MGYVQYMAPTKDGGYIAVGFADSLNGINIPNYHGNNDLWVAKLDAHCTIEWQKCFGSSGYEWGYKVEQTFDGGYIIGGIPGDNSGDVVFSHGKVGIWILKIDYKGNLQWQKTFGGSGNDIINTIKQTKDGGYIFTARTTSHDGNVVGHHNAGLYMDDDGWVVKLDSLGNIEWQKCLGGSSDDSMEDILETDDGGYITIGYTLSNDGDITYNHGYGDGWVVKLNYLGKIEWQKCYGGTDGDGFNCLIKTNGNGYILGGGTSSSNGDVSNYHGGGDMWLVKIDSIGNIIWQKCYGGSLLENFWSLTTTVDKGCVFVGTTLSDDGDISYNHGAGDYWVVKVDSLGTIKWQKCFGGSYFDQPYIIYQTSDGGSIIGGISGSQVGDGDVTIHYNIDTLIGNVMNWWVFKLASETNPIKIENSNLGLLIIPNPAHNYLGIETNNIKEIRILDVGGKLYMHEKVKTSDNIYSYFNIQYLAKGVYIVQAAGNDGSIKVGKLMVE